MVTGNRSIDIYPFHFKMLVQEYRAISLLGAPMKSWHSLTNWCNNKV